MFLSMGTIQFIIGPLHIGLSGTSLSPAGSRHRYTVPLGLGTMTKLLHYLAILSPPSGASIWFFLHSFQFFSTWIL